MTKLMDRDVQVQEVLATTPQKAKALDDPIRAELLNMLAHDPLSVGEMVENLTEGGIEKAATTVRHHVDVLREAGLIELTRLEEERGGVVKYYGSRTRLLGYEEPEDLEERLGEALQTATERMEDLVEELRESQRDEIEALAEELKPCPYCDTGHFEEYVLAQVVQRALARAL